MTRSIGLNCNIALDYMSSSLFYYHGFW